MALLSIDPETSLTDDVGSTASSLRILGVIRDPGSGGTEVTVTVIVTALIACDQCTDEEGSLRVNDNEQPVFCDDAGNELPPVLDNDGNSDEIPFRTFEKNISEIRSHLKG